MRNEPSDSSDRSDKSDKSDRSDRSDRSRGIIPVHGGYRRLRSFQIAQVVYDGTLLFCDRFVDRRSRTHDQMVQAARSGVQNIAEGSLASGTSKKTELKLTGVARASLGELLRDYEDFLRHRGLRLWAKDSAEALAVRGRRLSDPSDMSDSSDPSDRFSLRTVPAETAANTLICLIHQAMYLLRRQLERLEQDFLEHGGVTERLYRLRRERRAGSLNSSDQSDQSDASRPPACPRCASAMVRRTARHGPRAGQAFWGCPAYPECTGTRP